MGGQQWNQSLIVACLLCFSQVQFRCRFYFFLLEVFSWLNSFVNNQIKWKMMFMQLKKSENKWTFREMKIGLTKLETSSNFLKLPLCTPCTPELFVHVPNSKNSFMKVSRQTLYALELVHHSSWMLYTQSMKLFSFNTIIPQLEQN